MKILAVIAEYNPFHNGHLYHLNQSVKKSGADHILVLMSGSVVQRGEFAIIDKWKRTKAALDGGADLVCELPYIYACQSAEYFASGAISILNTLKVCDFLSFGCETENTNALYDAAEIFANEPADFKKNISLFLNKGLPFASAREKAASKVLNLDLSSILRSSNNILAVEYLKAIIRTQSAIQPIPILRTGSKHDERKVLGKYASASEIRRKIKNGETVSEFLPKAISVSPEESRRISENFENVFITRLICSDLAEIRKLPDVSEGLEFALKNALNEPLSFDRIVDQVSSKRIPKSRIRRIAMNMVMNMTKDKLKKLQSVPPYLRVLGLNDKGAEIISAIKKTSDIPILTNLRSNQTKLSPLQRQILECDVQACNLREYFSGHTCYNIDYTHNPIVQISK